MSAAPRQERSGAISSRFFWVLLLFVSGSLEGRALLLGPKRAGHPVIADEFVYLFQAELLAQGHLSAPSPPLPEFFEAAHLLVVPRFAGKYLPGHPLLLTPFIWLQAPWLGPALELGALAALLFLLARAAGLPTFAALLAGLIPLCSEAVAAIFGTYLSWTSSLPVTAAGLGCLVVAHRRRDVRALALGAALSGLLFWIRPFSGVAMILTLAGLTIFHLGNTRARKLWLLAACAPLLVWAALTCAVCKNVTGDYTVLPWLLYARQYVPADGPGFGVTHFPAPERDIPSHLRPFFEALHTLRDRYTVAAALERIPEQLHTLSLYEPSRALWPLALLGLAASIDLLAPVLLFSLLFYLLQLTFYAPTPFYLLELSIPLALGFAGAAARVAELGRRLQEPGLRVALWLGASAPLALGAGASLASIHQRATSGSWVQAPSESALEPARRAHGLVFIHYVDRGPDNLNYNDPNLQTTPLVRALDLGARDAELAARFPDRPVFYFDAATNTLSKSR